VKVLYSIREIHYRKMMRMFLVFWATVWQQAWCLRTMNADHQPDVGVETGTDYNTVLSNSTPLSLLQKVFLQKSCKPEETKAGTCSETDDQKRNWTKKGNKSTPRKNKFLGSPAKSIESKEEFLDESDPENGGDSSEENDGANNVNGNKGNMEKAGMYLVLVLGGALVVYMLWILFMSGSRPSFCGGGSEDQVDAEEGSPRFQFSGLHAFRPPVEAEEEKEKEKTADVDAGKRAESLPVPLENPITTSFAPGGPHSLV